MAEMQNFFPSKITSYIYQIARLCQIKRMHKVQMQKHHRCTHTHTPPYLCITIINCMLETSTIQTNFCDNGKKLIQWTLVILLHYLKYLRRVAV